MLPTRGEWSSWKKVDKIAYIAQVAAVFSLLPTTMFAFLSWREARLARDDQSAYFIAEKAPVLQVESLSMANGATLTMTVKNTGDSAAILTNAQLLVVRQDGDVVELPQNIGPSLGDSASGWRIRKAEELRLPIWTLSLLREKSPGYRPSAIVKYSIGEPPPAPSLDSLWLTIYYKDVLGNKYVSTATFSMVR
jgi:hypothetical protein